MKTTLVCALNTYGEEIGGRLRAVLPSVKSDSFGIFVTGKTLKRIAKGAH